MMACCADKTRAMTPADIASRAYGNVPLSQQQAQRESADSSRRSSASPLGSAASRTFGNVPLSQQKPKAE